jgi:hypothetical protein
MAAKASGTSHSVADRFQRSQGSTHITIPAAMEIPQTTTLPRREDPVRGTAISSANRTRALARIHTPAAIFATTSLDRVPLVIRAFPVRVPMPPYRHIRRCD